jgi:single-strand DNA-binding protein
MLRLQCIGYLGKDAVVNNVSGKTVINFNLAHGEKYKDVNGTEINKTVWVACAYWSEKTKVAQYLTKGSQVWVEGQPDVKIYKDSQGANHANITLRVMNIQLIGDKKEGGSGTPQNNNQPQQNNNGYVPYSNDVSAPVDDLPF